MMKTIPLSQGKFALVDDADYEAVSQFKWCAAKNGQLFYAQRSFRKPDGGWTTQSMHKFLIPGAAQIDHRDGDGLNNQRYNLRPTTTRQNLRALCRKRLGVTSKFRGVSWSRTNLNWVAQIEVNDKGIYLGRFTDEIKAAHAYDSAAVFYFGEWASTNFPIGDITIT